MEARLSDPTPYERGAAALREAIEVATFADDPALLTAAIRLQDLQCEAYRRGFCDALGAALIAALRRKGA